MPGNVPQENIINILSIARKAPSVHNIQPWQVSVSSDQWVVSKSPVRVIRDGDPTGRQTILCLGIFTEALSIGMASNGYEGKNVRFKSDGSASIQITTPSKNVSTSDNDTKALESRFTDRSEYTKIKLSSKQQEDIEASWNSSTVEVKVVSDPKTIETVARLTKQGLLLALSSPGFRKELAQNLVGSNKTPYGIPTPTLQNGKLKGAVIRRLIARGARRKAEANTEQRRWLSASALVFVLGKGDSPEYWFEAGRAYLRASIEIEKLGLHQATSAAIVEASDFHEDIEALIGTKMRILGLLRVGKSNAKPAYSGRYEPEELLTT